MAENSLIEWTDHTVNLWWGCSKVHTGCKNCYAEKWSARFGEDIWGIKASRKIIKSAFKDLAKYQRKAAKEGVKYRIFCGSMMDIFEDDEPMIDSKGDKVDNSMSKLRARLFNDISLGLYDNLVFLFLTKRPENINSMIPLKWGRTFGEKNYPKNVWFGTSLSDQYTAKVYLSRLLRNTPKHANLFLSVEPQVGPIDLGEIKDLGRPEMPNIGWIIQGGESGPKRRPFDLDWAFSMRDYAKKQGVPYFFKQIDKVEKIPAELMIRELPKF